jgi:acetyl esterase/lipase
MPQAVQERLQEVGPGWGKNITANIARTLEVYEPILATAPKSGVKIAKDVAYGPDLRHRIDIFQPEGKTGVPVVVFFHGGAYVRGDRSISPEVYANVTTYFARHGFLGINGTYRLAPAAIWPAAAQDVAQVVKWAKDNAASFGGDPNRIYLIGHSAGATHVATYAFMKTLQEPSGPGVAGIVLMSGRYFFDPHPDDPNLKNFQAYFGADPAAYPRQSPINYVKDAPRIPVFVVVAEYDNPDLDTQGALLLSAFCERDRACPRFLRMEKHNHLSMTFQFNTKDELLGREILEFIARGR